MQERTQRILDMLSLRNIIQNDKRNKLELMNEVEKSITERLNNRLDNITHYYNKIPKPNSPTGDLLKCYRQGNIHSLAQNSKCAEDYLNQLTELENFFYRAEVEKDIEDNYNYSLEIFLTELQNKIINEYQEIDDSLILDNLSELNRLIMQELTKERE